MTNQDLIKYRGPQIVPNRSETTQDFSFLPWSQIFDFLDLCRPTCFGPGIPDLTFMVTNYQKQWFWWHCHVGDLIMVTGLRFWWQNPYVVNFLRSWFLSIFQNGDQHLKLVTNTFRHLDASPNCWHQQQCYPKVTVMLVTSWCWWQRDVSYLKPMKISGCWWQKFDVDDMFLMLVM